MCLETHTFFQECAEESAHSWELRRRRTTCEENHQPADEGYEILFQDMGVCELCNYEVKDKDGIVEKKRVKGKWVPVPKVEFK